MKREAEEAGRRLAEDDLIPHWSPNQLRHTAATEIRKAYGLESVQAVLGHASMRVSENYAQRNLALAAEIMRKIG
jgi:integrase